MTDSVAVRAGAAGTVEVAEMNALIDLPDGDLLGTWAVTRKQRVRLHGRMAEAGLRFAFYGRVSTKDYQDPVSSRRWQLDFVAELVAGHGRITAQFFDVGYSLHNVVQVA